MALDDPRTGPERSYSRRLIGTVIAGMALLAVAVVLGANLLFAEGRIDAPVPDRVEEAPVEELPASD